MSRREAWLNRPANQWLVPGAFAVAPVQVGRHTVVEALGVVQQVGTHPWRDEEIPDQVYLRPPGGGIEWQAPVRSVKPAPPPTGASAR